MAEFEGWSSSINMVELSTVAPTDGSICTVSGWGAMSSVSLTYLKSEKVMLTC